MSNTLNAIVGSAVKSLLSALPKLAAEQGEGTPQINTLIVTTSFERQMALVAAVHNAIMEHDDPAIFVKISNNAVAISALDQLVPQMIEGPNFVVLIDRGLEETVNDSSMTLLRQSVEHVASMSGADPDELLAWVTVEGLTSV